jgi:DNA-binding NarL/FixJ family response regulator
MSEGLVVTNPTWLERLYSGQVAFNGEKNEMVETLTEREVEILQLMALGLTNKQIAGRLGISPHTVKFHVSAIFGKMGTTNRTETVKLGLKTGLILL